MRLSCVLLLLWCIQLAPTSSLAKSRQKGSPRPKASKRKAKKIKSESKREDAPSPIKSESKREDAPSPTRSPTRKPIRSPVSKPTRFPTSSPTRAPIADNVFDVANDRPTEPPHQEILEDTPPALPQFVAVSVSVAFPHSTPQSEDLQEKVAKVATLLVSSFTPFRVDMQPSRCQSTDLMYDEEHSKVVLAVYAPQVSWWKYSVAYAVTQATEEQEEMAAIVNLTKSSVEGAIQSGLFVELLAQETTIVRGVAIPGFELEQELNATPTKATTTAAEEGHGTWDYRATILVTCFFAIVLFAAALITVVMRRRWRQREWQTWSIAMAPQQSAGEILSTDWKSDYSEAVPSVTNASFLLMTADETIQATTNGTVTSIPSLS